MSGLERFPLDRLVDRDGNDIRAGAAGFFPDTGARRARRPTARGPARTAPNPSWPNAQGRCPDISRSGADLSRQGRTSAGDAIPENGLRSGLGEQCRESAMPRTTAKPSPESLQASWAISSTSSISTNPPAAGTLPTRWSGCSIALPRFARLDVSHSGGHFRSPSDHPRAAGHDSRGGHVCDRAGLPQPGVRQPDDEGRDRDRAADSLAAYDPPYRPRLAGGRPTRPDDLQSSSAARVPRPALRPVDRRARPGPQPDPERMRVQSGSGQFADRGTGHPRQCRPDRPLQCDAHVGDRACVRLRRGRGADLPDIRMQRLPAGRDRLL